MGIWDPEYDQTDVNATCRSVSGGALAFGDDYGKVKLMRYPVAVEGTAACAAYGGHSSHVTCVRFSHDDAHVAGRVQVQPGLGLDVSHWLPLT